MAVSSSAKVRFLFGWYKFFTQKSGFTSETIYTIYFGPSCLPQKQTEKHGRSVTETRMRASRPRFAVQRRPHRTQLTLLPLQGTRGRGL